MKRGHAELALTLAGRLWGMVPEEMINDRGIHIGWDGNDEVE